MSFWWTCIVMSVSYLVLSILVRSWVVISISSFKRSRKFWLVVCIICTKRQNRYWIKLIDGGRNPGFKYDTKHQKKDLIETFLSVLLLQRASSASLVQMSCMPSSPTWAGNIDWNSTSLKPWSVITIWACLIMLWMVFLTPSSNIPSQASTLPCGETSLTIFIISRSMRFLPALSTIRQKP